MPFQSLHTEQTHYTQFVHTAADTDEPRLANNLKTKDTHSIRFD